MQPQQPAYRPTLTADEPAGRPVPSDPDALLHQAEAAYLTGLSGRTLETFRLRGGGPLFVVLAKRAVRYRRRDVLAWIDSRVRRSTSDSCSSVV